MNLSPDLPYAWVLNPDAEIEVSSSGPYQTKKKSEILIEQRRHLFRSLVQGEPHYFAHDLSPQGVSIAPGTRALFWSPTPRIVRLAEQRGFLCAPSPSKAVLRTVFHKGFLARTGCITLPGHSFVEVWGDYERLWENPTALPPSTRHLRLKRPFGCAGRGQLRVNSELSPSDRRWIADSLRSGGFVLEPDISNARTLSLHGMIVRDEIFLGSLCEFWSDPFGAPLDPLTMKRCTTEEPESLRTFTQDQAERAAGALRRVGYEGPFGLDFLLGAQCHACIDLNPRFTLAWSLGMGEGREVALQALLRAQCTPAP